MHPTRTLLATAITASALIALMATSAFAQSVEVVDEATGSHCPDTVVVSAGHDVSGGCEITAASEEPAVTFAHIPAAGEIATSSCQSAFTANVSPRGGYVDVDANTIQENEATGCALEACDEAAPSHAELEWPISGLTETGAGTETLTITFCIRVHSNFEGTGNTVCSIAVRVVQTAHAQELTAAETPCLENPSNELTGHWVTTGVDEVELNHIHYPGDNL